MNTLQAGWESLDGSVITNVVRRLTDKASGFDELPPDLRDILQKFFGSMASLTRINCRRSYYSGAIYMLGLMKAIKDMPETSGRAVFAGITAEIEDFFKEIEEYKDATENESGNSQAARSA
jgi:hypothetical protein